MVRRAAGGGALGVPSAWPWAGAWGAGGCGEGCDGVALAGAAGCQGAGAPPPIGPAMVRRAWAAGAAGAAAGGPPAEMGVPGAHQRHVVSDGASGWPFAHVRTPSGAPHWGQKVSSSRQGHAH